MKSNKENSEFLRGRIILIFLEKKGMKRIYFSYNYQ